MEPARFEALYPPDTRFDEIAKLLQLIKEGKSCQLLGLPGVGRANILGCLAYNRSIREKHLGENQKWFHFVIVDFSEVRGKSSLDVMKLLFLELADSLRERKLTEEYEKTNAIFKESLSMQDELVLFQGMKKTIDYLAIEKELTIVFSFERFEAYIPSVAPDFFTNLRVLRNHAKYRFATVFSLSRPLEDLLEPTLFADFYEFLAGNTIYLPLLDNPGLAFRVKYLEKVSGKRVSHKLLETIISFTAGHGKLTRLCLEASISQNLSVQGITQETLLAYKTVQGVLQEIWFYLNPSEQQQLIASMLHDTNVENAFLEKVYLLNNGKIQIPLFAAFVKAQKDLREHVAFTFDLETNTIRHGDDIISDTLTASEFRLLLLLLQHPNTVLERDAIINTVWKDLPSAAGVTDQAIDQLTFRLRKKIEANPNDPKHIQTVKGRGLRFTP